MGLNMKIADSEGCGSLKGSLETGFAAQLRLEVGLPGRSSHPWSPAGGGHPVRRATSSLRFAEPVNSSSTIRSPQPFAAPGTTARNPNYAIFIRFCAGAPGMGVNMKIGGAFC